MAGVIPWTSGGDSIHAGRDVASMAGIAFMIFSSTMKDVDASATMMEAISCHLWRLPARRFRRLRCGEYYNALQSEDGGGYGRRHDDDGGAALTKEAMA